MMPNIYSPIVALPFKENKHEQLSVCQNAKSGKEIQSIHHEDLGKELYNLRKALDEELHLRNYHSLKYEDLCVHPNVELPPEYKLPKFNTFGGKGDPVAHLKDYCSRIIEIEHDEAVQMRRFIQSLSGLALAWCTKQEFRKWFTWEDMARDFARQYEFNIGDNLHMIDFLKEKKMLHESFQEYVMRWRLEALKIHPPLLEDEFL